MVDMANDCARRSRVRTVAGPGMMSRARSSRASASCARPDVIVSDEESDHRRDSVRERCASCDRGRGPKRDTSAFGGEVASTATVILITVSASHGARRSSAYEGELARSWMRSGVVERIGFLRRPVPARLRCMVLVPRVAIATPRLRELLTIRALHVD